MKTIIHSGSVITTKEILPNHSVLIEDQWIKDIQVSGNTIANARSIDAYGCFISPGWIDLHTHGAVGHDFIEADSEKYDEIGKFFAQNGVTRYLSTVMEKNGVDINEVLSFQKFYVPANDAAKPLGVHLEGPYFNSKFPGDMNPLQLRSPQLPEYQKWIQSEQIRLMTIAPELEGANELITIGRMNGIKFALGHCAPDEHQVALAIESGADQVSHLFNQMAGLHHRMPGLATIALMDNRITCQIIADREHLHPAVLKLICKLKPFDKLILITDSTAECGLPPHQIQEKNTKNNTVPGNLTMDQAVRNMVLQAGVSLYETVQMASFSPAVAMGLDDRFGKIQSGNIADLLLLDNQLNVVMTMIAGRVVFDPQNRYH